MSQPEKYRDVRAFSQSSLKLLDFNPQKFYWDEYRWVMGESEERKNDPPTDPMILGTIVDILLTRPNDLEKEFVWLSDPPTGQLKAFIDSFWKFEQQGADAGQSATQAYSEVGIKQSKLETMVTKFQDEGLPYYNSLKKAVGKALVSAEVLLKAKTLVKEMLEDEFMGSVLLQEDAMEHLNEWIEVHYQLEIYYFIDNIPVKALLDKVIVDHLKKTVQPLDVKTCGENSFMEAFAKRRYDIQGAFYTDALRHWMVKQGLEDYNILPFQFHVAFTNERGIKPQIWQMGTYDYYGGRYGIDRPGLKRVRGYQQMITDLKWHMKENKWKYPREVYMKRGIRELNYYIDEPRRT